MNKNILLDAAAYSPRSVQYPNSWVGHLPFAAWVIQEISPAIFVELGTHSGNSYFSFCQAVVEAGISTKCYAVDTWQGDVHAGQYGDEIFPKVNAHHQERYARFSRLLRMTFDDALPYFSDQSIELLHIDGLHTYEAVHHDFESWLPKLAPGAVVLFHDTNVRESNFGVWKLWEELQTQYPNNLEFLHSHGLGVLQLKNAPDDMRQEWLQPNSPEKQQLVDYFAALGSKQLERFELDELRQLIPILSQDIAERNEKIGAYKRDLQIRDGQIACLNQIVVERDGQIGGLNRTIIERDAQIVGLTQALLERDGQIVGLTQALLERDGQIAGLTQALLERDGQIAGFTQAASDRDGQVADLIQVISSRDQQINGFLNSLSWRLTKPLRRLRQIKRTIFWVLLNVLTSWLSSPSLLPLKQFREYLFVRNSFLFDKKYYLANNQDVSMYGIDPAWHYIIYGATENRNPHPLFDTLFYLTTYSDVSVSKINPLFHYLKFGLAEGRKTIFCEDNNEEPDPSIEGSFSDLDPSKETVGENDNEEPDPNIEGDFSELDPSKETVMVVSHEASLTGAPILSLNIVQWLTKKYNVVSILLGDGIIKTDFRRAGAIVVGPPILQYDLSGCNLLIEFTLKKCQPKYCIVNSIESRLVLPTLSDHFVPTISLIHEFAVYTRPREAIIEAIHLSGETIFSSALTQENAKAAYPILWDSLEAFQHILPQGRCQVPKIEFNSETIASEEKKIRAILRLKSGMVKPIIVIGLGYVHLRKGVDLFIECASQVIKKDQSTTYRFLWIGAGYDPGSDIGYSVYLEDQISRAGLQGHLFFMDQTRNIEAAYKMADILLLSSRLDPLPNVAIDAMSHALPVVCFENTTGIADILTTNGLGEYCVAPYLDTTSLAEKITMLASSERLRGQIGLQLQQVALQEFDMKRYVDNLDKIAINVETRTRQEKADVDYLLNSTMFREDFYVSPKDLGLSRNDLIRSYVRTWASGIQRRKPIPGFHPGVYFEQHGVTITGRDPFADYLAGGLPEGPWNSEVISSKDQILAVPDRVKVALHLHVYYPDILLEIITPLQQNKIRPDLFISVPTEPIKEIILSQIQSYNKSVEVRVVPNRGRDIGPFLTEFGHTLLTNYDLIGHLHTKKSENLNSIDFVNQWRHFLLRNLIGDGSNMADIILGRMAADDTIGLVFPDDPHVVSWSKNRIYADDLAKRLSINRLPTFFNFPIGTMFWARTEALRPLFELGLQWEDYPEEPLPYDGSLVHALERILPFVSSQNGFRSVVTNLFGVTR